MRLLNNLAWWIDYSVDQWLSDQPMMDADSNLEQWWNSQTTQPLPKIQTCSQSCGYIEDPEIISEYLDLPLAWNNLTQITWIYPVLDPEGQSYEIVQTYDLNQILTGRQALDQIYHFYQTPANYWFNTDSQTPLYELSGDYHLFAGFNPTANYGEYEVLIDN